MLIVLGVLLVIVLVAVRKTPACKTPKADAPIDQHRGWFGKL